MSLLFSVHACAACGIENYFDVIEEGADQEEVAAATPPPVQCRRCLANGPEFLGAAVLQGDQRTNPMEVRP